MWSKTGFARKVISAKLNILQYHIVWCLKVTEAYDCNLMNINGLYVLKLVRNDILQLIMRFLSKNLFCSKGRWRSSWIFVIFGQTRNASFKIQTGDLHQSFFHLNALKNLVHWETTGWNKWILAFHLWSMVAILNFALYEIPPTFSKEP